MAEPRRSLKRRVTLGATAVLVAALTVAVLVASVLLRRSLTGDVDATLRDRIAQVVETGRRLNLPRIFPATGREVGQVQVVDARGRLIASSFGMASAPGSNFAAFEPPPMNRSEVRTVESTSLDGRAGERFRVMAHTVDGTDGPVTIWAISSLEPAEHAERYLRNGLLLGLPALAALALFLIWRIVARSLAPVDSMRAEVDRIGTTDLSARVSPAATDDEIGRLAVTLNRLLDRVEESSIRQQLFAAAASHELRSPLSAIRTGLEVAVAYPDRTDWPSVARDSLIEVDRLERLSRDLRVLTRVRRGGSSSPLELAALVRAELERRQPPMPVTFRATPLPVMVDADAESMLQLVRNLLDNAERHAASAILVDCSVVTGADGGERVVLTVANDGPPIPEADRERIFEPFMRLDEARSLDEGGSGLGLAIARAMAQHHGGTLVAADPGTGGGALFRAEFPVPPRQQDAPRPLSDTAEPLNGSEGAPPPAGAEMAGGAASSGAPLKAASVSFSEGSTLPSMMRANRFERTSD